MQNCSGRAESTRYLLMPWAATSRLDPIRLLVSHHRDEFSLQADCSSDSDLNGCSAEDWPTQQRMEQLLDCWLLLNATEMIDEISFIWCLQTLYNSEGHDIFCKNTIRFTANLQIVSLHFDPTLLKLKGHALIQHTCNWNIVLKQLFCNKRWNTWLYLLSWC